LYDGKLEAGDAERPVKPYRATSQLFNGKDAKHAASGNWIVRRLYVMLE
jgi:hypothetical protein